MNTDIATKTTGDSLPEDTKPTIYKVNPLVRLNATRTPEERKAAATAAGIASGRSRRKRKEEQEALVKAASDLIEAGKAVAAGELDNGYTVAGAAMSSLADIMCNSASEQNRIKALQLFSTITGQQAATQVKLDTTIDKPFDSINLSELSDADLLKLAHQYRIIDSCCTDVVSLPDTDTDTY